MVVLCGYNAVKEALVDNGEGFGGRPSIPIIEQVSKGYRQAFDAMPDITAAVSNAICSVVFGNRFSYEDSNFIEILHITKDLVGFFMCVSGVVYNAIPRIMNHLPGPHNKLFSDSAKICAFIREKVESHKSTLDPQNPGDLIDCFLLKLQKEQSFTAKISTEDLVMTVLHLFLAGSDTTSSNLIYGLLMLARFPHIQAKIQHEIDEVVGANRAPGMENRMKMPYTNAAVHKILRYQQGSSETFPHVTTQNVDFRGYNIPKGTLVLPLFVSVHYDPLYWEAPDEFDPGHFLDENGEFRKREAFLPFSTGKRVCPGEALAQMELFLFFSTLLQNFTFQLVVNPEKMDIGSMFLDCRKKGQHRQLGAIRCNL